MKFITIFAPETFTSPLQNLILDAGVKNDLIHETAALKLGLNT